MNYSLVYAGAPGCHEPPSPQRGPGSPPLQGLPGSATVPANPTPQPLTGHAGPSGSAGAPGQMPASGTKLNYHFELLVCQMSCLFTCECICRDNSLFDDRSPVTLSKC